MHSIYYTNFLQLYLLPPLIAGKYKMPLPDWILVRPVINQPFQYQLALRVDMGEASAIALAHEIEFNYLITDDLAARKLSAELGISIIGTLGILLRAKQQGLISTIKPLMEKIRQTNFRLSDELYLTALIKRAKNYKIKPLICQFP